MDVLVNVRNRWMLGANFIQDQYSSRRPKLGLSISSNDQYQCEEKQHPEELLGLRHSALPRIYLVFSRQ
jgi:hypothetical protein